MSIANEISRIKSAKESLKNAINSKGGKLTNELLDKFADAVTALPEGSSVDLDGVTVTADQLREGVVAVDASGNKVTGTIPDSEVMTVESWSKIFVSSGYLAESLEITDGSALKANLAAATAGSNAVLEFFTFVDAEGVLRNGSIRNWDSRTGEGIEVNGNRVTVLSGHRSEDTSVTVASTDTDLSFVTATASDILAGKVGIDTYGNPVNGTIPTVTAFLTDNVVIIPAGYHDAAILTVEEAAAPTVSGNIVTVNKGYQAAEKTVTVGTAKAAETITPGTADKTIAKDTYLTGDLTVKGDANLLPENIADGVEIFGVPGAHKGGGSSGADFYKCAAVHGPYDAKTVIISGCPTAEINGEYIPTEFTTEDWNGTKNPVYKHATANYYYFYEPNNWMTWGVGTDYTSDSLLYMGSVGDSSWSDSNWNTVDGMTGVYGSTVMDADVPKTWDGYKAVLRNGVYSFEDTLTEGLTYSAVKPQEFGVYNSDASIKADWLIKDYPTDNLVFFAPLTERLDKADVGGAMVVKPGTVEIENGMAKFLSKDNYNALTSELRLPFPVSNYEITIHFQFISTDVQSSGTGEPFKFGGSSYLAHVTDNGLKFFNSNDYFVSISENALYTVTLVRKGDKWNVFMDGELKFATTKSDGFGDKTWVNIGHYFVGYIKNVLVYNRALSESEIGQLYAKFGGN